MYNINPLIYKLNGFTLVHEPATHYSFDDNLEVYNSDNKCVTSVILSSRFGEILIEVPDSISSYVGIDYDELREDKDFMSFVQDVKSKVR